MHSIIYFHSNSLFKLKNKNIHACSPYANFKKLENLNPNFAILASLDSNIVRNKILILSIIICNRVHMLKLLSSWDMPQWTHKYWKLNIQFWWNPSVSLKNMYHVTKSIWYTTFSCKNIFMLKNIFIASKKHEILAIFTYFRTKYTMRPVKHCHIILSSLISDSMKYHMNSSTNAWNTQCQSGRNVLVNTVYIYMHYLNITTNKSIAKILGTQDMLRERFKELSHDFLGTCLSPHIFIL